MSKVHFVFVQETCSCESSNCDCRQYPSYYLTRNGAKGYGTGGYSIDGKFYGNFLGLEFKNTTLEKVISEVRYFAEIYGAEEVTVSVS